MPSFQISINGKNICTASVGKSGVTDLVLLERNSDEQSETEKAPGERIVHLIVSGYRRKDHSDENEHLDWVDQYLATGDELLIRILETEVVDVPVNIYSDDPEEQKRQRRQFYEQLKQEFEDN